MRRFDNIEYEDKKLHRVKYRKRGKKIRISLRDKLEDIGEEVEMDDAKLSRETAM